MKLIGTGVIILLLGAVLFIFCIKISLTKEGYGTWEAVRNNLFRDGQIAIIISPDSTISNTSSNCSKDVTWQKNVAVVRVGYVWEAKISLEYRTSDGQTRHLVIKTDKPNNWHRVLFVQDQSGKFRKLTNGIEQEDTTTVITQNNSIPTFN
jgi:hypothetical protein